MKDFTVKAYEQLLDAIKSTGIEVFNVAGWVRQKPLKGILLRHDVDRKPQNALRIAKIENKYKTKSTYYFRVVGKVFNPEIIKAIADLGHEIGYHYEDLSLADGDYDNAKALFAKHLDMFKPVAKVETIAMHGRPFSRYDNRDMWKKLNFSEFGITAEAFLSIDYSDVYYFTDTGRTWAASKANIRDKVKSNLKADVNTTSGLSLFVKNNPDKKFAIVMHPERWEDNSAKWAVQYFKDIGINVFKRLMNANIS